MRMKKIWQSIFNIIKRIKCSVTFKTPIINVSFALSLIQPFQIGTAFL